MRILSERDQVQPPLDYSDSGPGIIIGSYVLALVTTIVVGLRFWAKRLTRASWGWDDYLILSCLLIHHVFLAFCTVAIVRGGLGKDMRVVSQDPHALVILFKFLFMAEVAYGFSCTLVKLAVLAFYLQIFPTKTVRMASIVLGTMSIAWTIAVEIVYVVQCRPLRAFWRVELQPLPTTKCIDTIIFLMGNSIANSIVDFCTIVLPVQEILKLQISMTKKLSICFIFLLGGVAFASSMTRTLSTAAMHREGTHNFTKQFVAPGLSSGIEVYVAIVGACLPTLIPIYRKLRYGRPNAPPKPIPAIDIVTFGSSPKKPQLDSEEGPGKDDDVMLSTYGGSCRVSVSGQSGRRSTATDSPERPPAGILVERDMTWSESKKPVVSVFE
ncbi:hypothetical protein F5Y11DRAFT_367222 [Daldinia sp. FL1419]|nr:hypothetical protein F5Y11DRAFT_367222 [Daldinia sp. FL1419]